MHDAIWTRIEKRLSIAIDSGGRKSVASQIDTALDAGWTETVLADWVISRALAARSVRSVAGFVISSLRDIPASAATQPRRRPECGECINGWIEDPVTGLPVSRCRCMTGANPTSDADARPRGTTRPDRPTIKRDLALISSLADSLTA